jgi:hypothetical protein
MEQKFYIYDHANGETYTIVGMENLINWLNETNYDFSFSLKNDFKQTEEAK